MTLEYRTADTMTLEGRTLLGRAIPFNSLSKPMQGPNGTFRERIHERTFTDYLASGEPTFALWNHERRARLPLGRRGVNLELRAESDGLHYSLVMPNTTEANDLLELHRSGVLAGELSFGFVMQRQRWERHGGEQVRTVERATLPEISLTLLPAYAGTSAQVRSLAHGSTWATRLWHARRGQAEQ